MDNKTLSYSEISQMSVTHEFPSNLERKLYYALWPELQHGDIYGNETMVTIWLEKYKNINS
jgi:hypothetical protein